MAELLGASVRRGGGGGRGGGERRWRTCSVVLRERAEEGEGVQGESKRVERECVASPGTSRGKRQAGGGRGACRRAANTRLASFWRGVGDDWQMGLVGCYSARPAR